MFEATPEEFVNVDLAANGNCIVCSVKANKQIPGKPEFTAIHDGMRYLFPSDDARQMFIAAPNNFLNAAKPEMPSNEISQPASAIAQGQAQLVRFKEQQVVLDATTASSQSVLRKNWDLPWSTLKEPSTLLKKATFVGQNVTRHGLTANKFLSPEQLLKEKATWFGFSQVLCTPYKPKLSSKLPHLATN